jgi:hypothetical protein
VRLKVRRFDSWAPIARNHQLEDALSSACHPPGSILVDGTKAIPRRSTHCNSLIGEANAQDAHNKDAEHRDAADYCALRAI